MNLVIVESPAKGRTIKNILGSGYKVLAFKGAKYIFSHKGGTNVYFLNPKNYQMIVSSQYFRDKGDTAQVNGQNAFYFLIYSALQFVITNRWRVGQLAQA